MRNPKRDSSDLSPVEKYGLRLIIASQVYNKTTKMTREISNDIRKSARNVKDVKVKQKKWEKF